MSVIVTGMDIPKSCGECNASGTGVCRKWFDVKEIGLKRSEHCPLKSVAGLIEKFSMVKGCGDFIATQDVIDIIKEYCGIEVE